MNSDALVTARFIMHEEAPLGYHLKFQREICRLSGYIYNLKNYDIAKKEWKVKTIDQADGGGKCVCGHHIEINVRIVNEKSGKIAVIGIDCSAHIAKDMHFCALKIKKYCHKIANDLLFRPKSSDIENLLNANMITADDVKQLQGSVCDETMLKINSNILKNYYKNNVILDNYGICQCGNLYFKAAGYEMRDECTSCVSRRQRQKAQEQLAIELKQKQERLAFEQKQIQELLAIEQKRLAIEKEQYALEQKRKLEVLLREQEKLIEKENKEKRERLKMENKRRREEKILKNKEKRERLVIIELEKQKQIQEDKEHNRRQKQIQLEQMEVGLLIKKRELEEKSNTHIHD